MALLELLEDAPVSGVGPADWEYSLVVEDSYLPEPRQLSF
jgi:hypothetical protein